jgi:hypothetical protein
MNEAEENDFVRQALGEAMPDDLPEAVEQRMEYQLTAFARKRGLKNAIICAVGMLFVWLAAATVICLVCDQGMIGSGVIAFAGQWGLVFLLFVGTWSYGRRAGGQIRSEERRVGKEC